MLGRLRWVRRLVLDLPHNLKLTYCLAFDPRVPVRNKAALAAALTVVVTPFIDVPLWVPVVGEMDVLALGLLATHLFISAAPDEVVAAQERLIAARRSRFDRDVEDGRRIAVAIARRTHELPEVEVHGTAVNRPGIAEPSGVLA